MGEEMDIAKRRGIMTDKASRGAGLLKHLEIPDFQHITHHQQDRKSGKIRQRKKKAGCKWAKAD
jgi:hypothetical protein